MRCGEEKSPQGDVKVWVQVSTHTVLFASSVAARQMSGPHAHPPASSAPGAWRVY